MDRDSRSLLTITAFKALNTNAPHGTHDQPTRLENVYLDRTGGYTSQSQRSLQVAGVTWAWPAGVGADMFYQTASTYNYYNAQTRVSSAIVGVTNPATSVPLMPGLVATYDNVAGGYTNQFIFKDGLTAASGPGAGGSFTFTYDTKQTGEVAFGSGVTYDFLVIYSSPDPVVVGHFAQARSFTFQAGAGVGSPPATEFIPVIDFPSTGIGSVAGTVYYRQTGFGGPWKIGASLPTTRVQRLELGLSPQTVTYFSFRTAPSMPHEYHQGRVWIAPDSYQYFDGSGPGLKVESMPNRVFYSRVIAAASLKASPTFSILGFIDVPFRVSRKVVALLGIGTYLYIFGDRELFLLSGDPEYGGRLESIADSIGAISASSVQQLGGVGYWLSDSGVMAVRGGQVQEVSTDVRDLVAGLGMSSVTSTVDFGRELYILTDGTTTLVYHARENGWTTRVQSETGTLVYGGGTPYAISTAGLFSLGGEVDKDGATPQRLVLTVEWGPLECGTWSARKRFDTLALGSDLATLPGTLTQQSDVLENGVTVTCDPQTKQVLPGPGYSLTHLSNDMTAVSGQSIRPRFVFASQDRRAILRPPLVLTGEVTGEVSVD